MKNSSLEIVAFCCHYCAYAAADLAGSSHLEYPVEIKIIRVPCSGKVEITHILKSLEKGADGVMVAGCEEGNCHFQVGNLRARKRVEYVKKLLEEAGWEKERVEMYNLSAGEGEKFSRITREFVERIRELKFSREGGRK